jgi:hypothetical protein
MLVRYLLLSIPYGQGIKNIYMLSLEGSIFILINLFIYLQN